MSNVQGATNYDRYKLNGSLGKGGMGEVFRVFDPHLQREVAPKAIPASALGACRG